MKQVLVFLFTLSALTFSCKKDEKDETIKTDTIFPTITLISPAAARDTTINNQPAKILSKFKPGSQIPIKINITDNNSVDSVVVFLTDSTNNNTRYFSKTYYPALPSFTIETFAIAPLNPSPPYNSISVEAFDFKKNGTAQIRTFRISNN